MDLYTTHTTTLAAAGCDDDVVFVCAAECGKLLGPTGKSVENIGLTFLFMITATSKQHRFSYAQHTGNVYPGARLHSAVAQNRTLP